ncbi:Vacuolar protein-sorting-associated protein 28 [Lambiella insularis]|nr:Vacuolar protein-sorting-associated protein 28 [Lambiella insularis]
MSSAFKSYSLSNLPSLCMRSLYAIPHSILSQEVKLPAHGTAERELIDSLAEVYSIIVTIDDLEKAYNRDSVLEAEYTEISGRLLKQYNNTLGDERVRKEFGDLEAFKREWNMDCPRATERLRIGLPSTLLHPSQPSLPSFASTAAPLSSSYPPTIPPSSASTHNPSPQSILLATENFITFLDALRIGLLAKDQLHPLLSEVIQSVNKVVEGGFEGRGSIIKWLIRLNGMRAQEELGLEDVRECTFEMEEAYAGFKAVLGG